MNRYEALKQRQGKISNEDFDVFILDNVLSDDQIDKIYKIVDSAKDEQTMVKKFAGHKLWYVTFGNEIENKITKMVQDKISESVVLDKDYSFARYSKKFGYVPKLFPHFDSRESQTIVCDIQLKSNTDWGIVVENKPYYLKFNQALVFSGTQQMHWREEKELSDSDEVDMIFCHLRYNPVKPLDHLQNEKMMERSWVLMEETGISNEEKQI